MKIAIPTNDGFTVAQQFRSAKGFLVMTIQLGEIVMQEMRWNLPGDAVASNNVCNSNLSDCESLIIHKGGRNSGIYLQSLQKEIIETDETIITKALLQYLNKSLLKETNVCCCP
jgi:predicted Fe-Mo cluster-binding NifX family protein